MSGVLPLGDVGRLADVLIAVNAALELEWDPATLGSLGAEVPGLGRLVIEDAFASALATF